ncbi:MAG TPA: peptidylprolyl isomerase [Candidatus Binatus sp.]|nr:peptidylprolyl isomerase [Candidatus Binatus sp.]
MEVATGRVVTLEYTVRLGSGTLIDSTGSCGPIAVLCGAGQLFPGLEDRLAGMQPGETRELRIPADEAYGAWRAELVRTIPRASFPEGVDPTVGGEYRVKAPSGKPVRFRVVEIAGADVRVDFNPPQAGQDLVATVTVIAVRAPTPDEDRRGRV